MSGSPPLQRRLAAEAVASFFLFTCVIGSGIMASNLSQSNDAVALLANTIATGAILFVLITMLGPVSGAHMNPAVSLVAALRRDLTWTDAGAYVAVQLGFGILGAWAAHLMFDLPALQLSLKPRTGFGQWLGEGIATFGLILTSSERFATGHRQLRLPLGSTSPPLTGSPHRPASPTRRSRSRAAFPTHSPESLRQTFRSSSSRS